MGFIQDHFQHDRTERETQLKERIMEKIKTLDEDDLIRYAVKGVVKQQRLVNLVTDAKFVKDQIARFNVFGPPGQTASMKSVDQIKIIVIREEKGKDPFTTIHLLRPTVNQDYWVSLTYDECRNMAYYALADQEKKKKG